MEEAAIDIGREMRDAPLSAFHLRFAALLGSVLFIDGYDLFNAGYVAPFIRTEWHLAQRELGLMLSIGLAGLAGGALLQGPLADRFGRRRVMLLAVWLLGLASLALATLAGDFTSFCLLRAALGLSLGMISPLAFVYINEWAPAASANRYATLAFVLPFSLGGIAAGLAGIALAPRFGWHALYLVGAVAIPIALLCHVALPESIRFLAAAGRWPEVVRILSKARPDHAARYLVATRFVGEDAPAGRGSIATLLDSRHRRTTLTIWVASALSLFCLHGLTGWLPTILLREGAAVNTAFGYGSLLMTMQIVGGAVAGWLADRAGRVPVMTLGFLGGALALLLLGATIAGDHAFVAVAGAGFFIFGTQAVMNNYTAMSYETHLRGTAVGLAVAFSRIGGVLGPIMIGWTQEMPHALWATLIMLAAAQAAASLVIASTGAGRRRLSPEGI